MFARKFPSFYKTSSCKIVHIPIPWRMPRENYIEPLIWTHKFPLPSQVRPRAFFDCNLPTKLGPNDKVAKEDSYKNPEYFAYHPYSY